MLLLFPFYLKTFHMSDIRLSYSYQVITYVSKFHQNNDIPQEEGKRKTYTLMCGHTNKHTVVYLSMYLCYFDLYVTHTESHAYT